MDKRHIVSNAAVALAVQGVAFIVSAVTAFVVPKILVSSDFGYWQLFLFYVGYIGFAQLGLSDGVYLRLGGTPRNAIDRTSVSRHFVVLCASQLLLASAVAASALIFSVGDRRFVSLAIAAMIPVMSAVRYWGFVFQAMNETKLFSYSVLLQNVGFVIPLVVLLAMHVTDERAYVAFYVFAQFPALVVCLYRGKELLNYEGIHLRECCVDVSESIRAGVPLLLSTLAATLVLGSVRFIVDANWGISDFGAASLSITVVTFFLTLLAQFSLVLFPALRQIDRERVERFVWDLRTVAFAALPVAYVFYFPIAWILSLWLPTYRGAFQMAAVLMPLCVFDGLMQILYSTFFKVVRRERMLLALNVAELGVAVIGVTVTGIWLHSLVGLFISAALASAVRSVVADRLLSRWLGFPSLRSMEALIVLTTIFVMAQQLMPSVVASGITIAAYAVFLSSRRKGVLDVIRRFRSARTPGTSFV